MESDLVLEAFPDVDSAICVVCEGDNPSILPLTRVAHPLETDDDLGLQTARIADGVCLRCGLTQRLPMPSTEELKAFYSQSSKEFGHFRLFSSSREERTLRKKQTDFLMSRLGLDKGAEVLDVGAFNGSLVSELLDRGLNAVGIDNSISRERLPNSVKDRIFPRFLDEQVQMPDRFQAIVLSHVLEHVNNPVDFLSKSAKLLQDNGQIFVEVPDMARADVRDFSLFTALEHTLNFTEQTLQNVVEVAGLEVGEIHTFDAEPTVGPVIRCLARPRQDGRANPSPLRDVAGQIRVAGKLLVAHAQEMTRMESEIRSFASSSSQRVKVWGAGVAGFRVLSILSKSVAEIEGVVDSDLEKQGKSLLGLSVASPDSLSGWDGIVVVASKAYFSEIFTQVQGINPSIRVWSPWANAGSPQ